MALTLYTAGMALPLSGAALWLATDNAAWLALCAPVLFFLS